MNAAEVGRLLQPWLDTEREYAFVVLSEPRGAALVARVGWGAAHHVEILLPELFRVPQAIGARRLLVAHSHPSGRLFVSDLDMELTRTLVAACSSNGLVLEDHVIVNARGEALSMVEVGLLAAPQIPLARVAESPHTR